MANHTQIEWTDATWNPTTGCDKVSPGCLNCYAKLAAERNKLLGQPAYRNGFNLTLHPGRLDFPRGIKKPTKFFVNSMSDLFHEKVPLDFLLLVFSTMVQTPQHTYQILTKRSDRLAAIARKLPWAENIWMGVSIENANFSHRIDHLRRVPAHVRFLSCEPLIGPTNRLDLNGVHWVIVGGESGPGARPMNGDWARSIRDQCIEQKVAFFFKQWGGVRKWESGRVLDGRTWDELPGQASPGVCPLRSTRR